MTTDDDGREDRYGDAICSLDRRTLGQGRNHLQCDLPRKTFDPEKTEIFCCLKPQLRQHVDRPRDDDYPRGQHFEETRAYTREGVWDRL